MNLPPRFKRHAFIGVGWIRDKADQRLYPCLLRISNYFRPGEVADLAEADSKFTVHCSFFARRNMLPWGWISTGVPLVEHERSWLQKRLVKWSRKSVGPHAVARLFIDTARKVANREQGVGKDLLITVLPKSAVELSTKNSGQVSVNAQIATLGDIEKALQNRTQITFWCLPADSDSLQQYAPAFVPVTGGFALGNIRFVPKAGG
jgi:hypothetical protein